MKKTLHEIRITARGWPDYLVRTWLINSAVCGVEAFEVIGTDKDKPMMLLTGWASSPDDSTTDCDAAETIVSGSIKWDGCSDLNIGRGGYVHACGQRSAARIGELIDTLYELARKEMGPDAVHDPGLFQGF